MRVPDWLKKNISGTNKEDEAAKMSKYENGISAYIEDDKVHNAFDSRIKSLGEAVFESNGNNIIIGDPDDPKKGGYWNYSKDGNNYTSTVKTVSFNPQTGQFVFNTPTTSSTFNLNPDELISEAFSGIQSQQEIISQMNLKLDEKNATIINNRTR
jgi:hypothetical protein